MPFCRSPRYILARIPFLCVAVGEVQLGGDLCSAEWMYALSSYLGKVVGNGDGTFLLPSVVVIRPIFTKERMGMLTLCPPLSDVAILQDIHPPPSEVIAKYCKNWVVVIHS